MREIKFRAWDKNDEVMRDWKDVILTKDKGDAFYMLGYEENKVITSFDHNQILLQYTGLKDKNGVEIYEGDIVKWFSRFGVETGKIEFARYGFHVVLESLYMYKIDEFQCEVIGNIYENPKLLEVLNG